MSKKDEALKLALEALEWINRVNAMEYEYQQKARESLNAIYEALAEQPAPVASPHEQEPVAWLQIGLPPLHGGDVIARTTKPTKWNPEWWRFEPLYTSPPAQRTWVGLTDEQFQAIKDSFFRQQGWDGEGWDLALKEAIEAKLKEKNT